MRIAGICRGMGIEILGAFSDRFYIYPFKDIYPYKELISCNEQENMFDLIYKTCHEYKCKYSVV